jgi:hypothetical protein
VIIEPTPLDASAYTTQYELLRSQVIGARDAVARLDVTALPRGVGLALLLREGMPGWLKGVENVIRASQPPSTAHAAAAASAAATQSTPAAAWLRGVPQQDLTALLASLVLSTRCVAPAVQEEVWLPCQ